MCDLFTVQLFIQLFWFITYFRSKISSSHALFSSRVGKANQLFLLIFLFLFPVPGNLSFENEHR